MVIGDFALSAGLKNYLGYGSDGKIATPLRCLGTESQCRRSPLTAGMAADVLVPTGKLEV